ncbi:MAG TPA: endonuclease MutS2 [Terriglobales bacterium]|nr:endonuclease MutS2 [Terriglobales bacterium]
MDEHTLRVLEFDKIKKILDSKCLSDLGRNKVASLFPVTEQELISRWQKDTTELKEILQFEEKFPLYSVPDLSDSFRKAERIGGFLEPREFLKIEELLKLCRLLLRFVQEKEKKYPQINSLIARLKRFDELSKAINKAIDSSAEIKDNATSVLFSIRQEKNTNRNKILEKLQGLSKIKKKEAQEEIVTLREGRYVVSLPAEEFNKSKGVVHDRSSSGATLFVEPLPVVELNNKQRELEIEEKKEIEKILKELTSLIRKDIEDLWISQEATAELDFIHSKALLSLEFRGNEPKFNAEGYLYLKDARHPILSLSGILSKEEIVPLSLELGKKFNVLIITGPNTGGKTVALKTIGIMALLAQAGLHISAEFGSNLPIFKHIFADIGDEQSIEMSLSTFSSHIGQIIKALKIADENSLVLLDELGSGTDPKEGVALGEAIVVDLIQKKVKTVITTHQGVLKTLAQLYPEVENASLEFDKGSLKPTYRFQIGYPGGSYGIEIARRLGMPENIVQRSFELLGSKERDLGLLLEELERNLKIVRENRKAVEEQKKVSDELVNLYQDRLKKLEASQKELKTKALKESRELVEKTRVEIEHLISELKSTKAKKEIIKQAHAYLGQTQKSLEEDLEKVEGKTPSLKEVIMPGDQVWIESLKMEGEVLSEPDKTGKVKLKIGNFTYTVEQGELSKVKEKKKEETIHTSKYELYSIKEISPEIDLRGLTADESIDKVDKYLDDAYLAGLSEVVLIHGKGTGALRKKIGEFLAGHHRVKETRIGSLEEGGAGVTIVKLKE